MIWKPSWFICFKFVCLCDGKPDGVMIHFWFIIQQMTKCIMLIHHRKTVRWSLLCQCMCHSSHTKLIDVTKQRWYVASSLRSDEGLQERELHLSIPRGSRNNSVTSSQPRIKSNKEKESVSEKGKKGREKTEESSTVNEGGWERKSGNASKERQHCKRRGEGKRNAAESFRWKLLEWEDHYCSRILTPPVWITANPAAVTRVLSAAVNAGRTQETSHKGLQELLTMRI